jgi:hypothetical protein
MHRGFSRRAASLQNSHAQSSPTQSKLSERASGAHSAQGVLRQAAQKESSLANTRSLHAQNKKEEKSRGGEHTSGEREREKIT